MKKTIGLIVSLLICLIMLTGCVNINYEVKINKDGSGEISYVYAFSKDALNSLQTSADDMTSSMKEQAEGNDYNIEKYEDDEYEGFKATKTVSNLEEEFSLQEAFGDEYVKETDEEADNGIKIDNNGFKTIISQNGEIDLTAMKDIASMVKMKYTVVLPVDVKSHNATEANGRTLTWDLVGGEVNKIEYHAESINILPIVLLFVLAVVIIATCVLCTIWTKKRVNNLKKDVKVEKKQVVEEKKIEEEKKEEKVEEEVKEKTQEETQEENNEEKDETQE